MLTIGTTTSGTGGAIDKEATFVETLARHGYAVVEDGRYRPTNHYIIGVGVGHDDATWAEQRFEEGSMASYYENGLALDGLRWWEDTEQHFSIGVRYYGCQDRRAA